MESRVECNLCGLVIGMRKAEYEDNHTVKFGSFGPDLNIKSSMIYMPGNVTVYTRREAINNAVSAFTSNGLYNHEDVDFVVQCMTGMTSKQAEQKGFMIGV